MEMIINKRIFIILLLIIIAINNCVSAEIDHHFKILEEPEHFKVLQSEAEEIAWDMFRYEHPRIIYYEESDKYLYNLMELEPDKTKLDDFWREIQVQQRTTPLVNDEYRFFWSIAFYANWYLKYDYPYTFIYAVVLDAQTGEIAEESVNQADINRHWKKEFGDTVFWSFETSALFDELYPNYFPRDWKHVNLSEHFITPEKAVETVMVYMTSREHLSPDDFCICTALISEHNDADQFESYYYVVWFISNEYVDIDNKTLVSDCPYYYCKLNAETGEITWIIYNEDDLHTREIFLQE